MVYLKSNEGYAPVYMTEYSACADLYAREDFTLAPQTHTKVPTGVWIDKVEWKDIPPGTIPELQIRCRSSLAFKYGIMLTNGLGTVDLDYPDEICVLLSNFGNATVNFKRGERIAQIGLNLLQRIPNLKVGGKRIGGFGSTQT